jgi:hypothetical protein
MPPSPTASASSPLIRSAFYILAIGLALVHVFITFRGLSSAAGMEQAQLARELARGSGFETKVIRPYAWARLISSGADPAPMEMPEISQPPLQALVLMPVFKMLSSYLVYDPIKNGSIFLMDRVIACVGVSCLLLTLLWTHGTARRLFDEKVAAVVVLALILCAPLWQLAASGSPVALMLPLFALCFRLFAGAQLKAAEGQSVWSYFLMMSVLAALMLMTHWMALWLVMGLVFAVMQTFPGRRAGAVVVAMVPLLVLAAWGLWMMKVCGDPLGGAKTLFQAHLLNMEPALLQRDFTIVSPPMILSELLRKLTGNLKGQLTESYAHLGFSVPAACFFIALFYRFRRRSVMQSMVGLSLIFLFLAIGMALLGLPEKTQDDHSLYLVLVPALAVFGTAILAVLWNRLQAQGGYFWQNLGFAVIAVIISAIPMIASLPADLKMGLTMRSRLYPHWPPYVPDRVSLVRRLVEKNEIIASDAPWFVAWYADVPCIWLPLKRADFTKMQTLLQAHETKIAGIVMTPISSQVNHLHEAFFGAYSEWPDLLFRGLMLAFDKDFQPRPDFEYKVPLPLVAIPVGEKENLSLQMTFYTDKMRSIKPEKAQ